MIFKRDTSAERRKTLEAASSAAATLAKLRTDRQAALLDADLDVIERHDAEIARQEIKISTLQEKLRLLTHEQRRERHDEREQNRADAIKRIAPELTKREKIAAELEVAIKKMSELWFALVEFPSPVHSHWPFPLPAGKFDLGDINREMSLALFAAARPIQGQLRMPQAASLDTGVQGRGAKGLSDVVSHQNATLLAILGSAPLGHDEEAA